MTDPETLRALELARSNTEHGGRRHGLNPAGLATVIRITLDDETRQVLETLAVEEHVSRAEVVRRALRAYWRRMTA